MERPLTEQMQALQTQVEQRFLDALVESEGRHRRVLDSISEVVFELDSAGCFRFLNQAWQTHTGLATGEAMGEPLSRYVLPEDRDLLTCRLEAGATAPLQTIDLRILHADGLPRWFAATITARLTAGKHSWFGSLANIHARREAEAARARQSRLLLAIARAQSSFILSDEPAAVVNALLREVAQMLGTGFACVVASAEALPGFALPAELEPHRIWLERVACWLVDDADESGKTCPAAGRLDVFAPQESPTIRAPRLPAVRLNDATANALGFIDIPDCCRGGTIMPLETEPGNQTMLLLGPTTLGFEVLHELLTPAAATVQQLLRVTRLRAARERDALVLERLSRVASQTSDCVIITDRRGCIEWVNEGFVRTTGYQLEEVVGRRPGVMLQGPGSDPEVVGVMREALVREQPFEVDLLNYRKSGEAFHVRIRCNPMTNSEGRTVGFIAIESDITREKQLIDLILASDRHKGVLLKEIHHRVKNNLQIISSLLTLQADGLESGETQALITESALRVRSMALIHEHLYGMTTLDRIDLGAYARDLGDSLRVLLAPSVRLRVQADVTELSIDASVPAGLILNELLTNAFKYGVDQGLVPELRSGGRLGPDCDVLVEVSCCADQVRLAVTDAGAGMKEGFDPVKARTLGLHLVNALTRQLRGVLSYDFAAGSRFELSFPRTPPG